VCHWVHAFTDGELLPAQRQAFCFHLALCRRCPRTVEEILGLRALAETYGQRRYPRGEPG
jgi:anti-sigma factor RsiW